MSRHHPRRVLLLIPLFLLAVDPPVRSQPAPVETSWIEAEGEAVIYDNDIPSARSRAIEAAKRNAVEKGLGVMVASQTLVRNYQLVSDRVLSRSSGFVRKYEVISEGRAGDNYRVTIRAQITEIIDQVLKDRMALELLLDWVHHPRVLVLIRENNMGDSESRVAESSIIGELMDKGFNLVDRGRFETSRYWDSTVDYYRNPEAVGRLGADTDAEIAVIGYARSDSGGDFYGLISGQAEIEARVVRTDTREILSTTSARGKAVHISKNIAGAKAIEEAAAFVLPNLYRDIIKTFSTEASGVVTVRLRLKGIDFESLEAVERYVQHQIGGVTAANRRVFRDDEAEIDVEYQGRPQDLIGSLKRFRLDDRVLTVISTTSRVIELKLEKAS